MKPTQRKLCWSTATSKTGDTAERVKAGKRRDSWIFNHQYTEVHGCVYLWVSAKTQVHLLAFITFTKTTHNHNFEIISHYFEHYFVSYYNDS